jgi:hypothetical protein
MKKNIYAFLIVLIVFSHSLSAQVIQFNNPSFEGTPQPHVTPPGWDICMPGVTPDTQPGSWGITLPPSDGNSYVGLVYSASIAWQEGVGAKFIISSGCRKPLFFYHRFGYSGFSRPCNRNPSSAMVC